MRNFMIFTGCIIIALSSSHFLQAQVTEAFITPGAQVWTVPSGVFQITVEVWGGGGSGGEGAGNESGGGGGGGAFAKKNTFSVVPGTSYDLFVGAGGANVTNGQDSWFNSPTFLKATGGSYGLAGDPGPGGSGGLAANCIGDVSYSGGNGANGIYSPGGGYGGGGGSSAGTAANGNHATSRIGATAPAGGGNGGDGGSIGGGGSSNPESGDTPGGGGGGSRNGNDEGSGGNGKVNITYEQPAGADLNITKTVTNSIPNVGDQVTFTITLTNQGPANATGVEVTDLLPDGYSYISHLTSSGTYIPGTGIWGLSGITYPGGATLTVTASVDAPTGTLNEYKNIATVSDSDQNDPDPSDNSSFAETDPRQSDLSVDKSSDNLSPGVGDLITFTISVTNQGPDAATSVVVKDVLPNGYTYVSDNGGSATTESGGTVTWTIPGSIASGGTATLQISVTVNAPGTGISYLNTAQVTDADQWDPDSTPNDNTGDDYDTEDFTIQGSDLSISKTVNTSTPNVGDQVTFTITFHNSGPDAATGVIVTDVLPAGLMYVSDDGGSSTSEDSGTITWVIAGSIGNGANVSLHIVAEVKVPTGAANEYKNVVQVTDADQYDPDSTPGDDTGDDYDDETVLPLQSDLKVVKLVDNPTPFAGGQVVFTIKVTNSGPNAATNVVANDLLDPDFNYISHIASQGTYDNISGIWNAGTLTNGGVATLTITATVVFAGTHSNSVNVSLREFDPDPDNNQFTVFLGPPVIVPVSSWAIYLSILLMVALVLVRYVKMN